VTATAKNFRTIETLGWDLGHAVSPDDAWLGSRGLRTMGVRLAQHEQSALRIANWLKQRPEVGRVLHPALPDCPGHEFWQRDFTGSSSVFSVVFKDGIDEAAILGFIDALALFKIGYSWGGVTSLAVPLFDLGRAHGPSYEHRLVRFNIGLEDTGDLIHDLDQALQRTGLAR